MPAMAWRFKSSPAHQIKTKDETLLRFVLLVWCAVVQRSRCEILFFCRFGIVLGRVVEIYRGFFQSNKGEMYAYSA